MTETINTTSFVEAIKEYTTDRFLIEIDEKLKRLASEQLTDVAVMRLKRVKTKTSYFRTILISILNDKSELKKALGWAAEVQWELLDPETSDLYMIIAIPSLSNESCTRIESTEEFCRKFVLRRDESINELISRTFIAHLSEEKNTEKISDPLTEALRKTEEDHPWFDSNIQKHWKQCLLSSETGTELIEKLYGSALLKDQAND